MTGKLSLEARKLDSQLKKAERNYQLVTADDQRAWNTELRGNYPAWKELARHYDEAADFFQKNL